MDYSEQGDEDAYQNSCRLCIYIVRDVLLGFSMYRRSQRFHYRTENRTLQARAKSACSRKNEGEQQPTQLTHLRDFSAHTCSAVYSSVASQSPGKVWLLYGARTPMGGVMLRRTLMRPFTRVMELNPEEREWEWPRDTTGSRGFS